tara:strand:+ start:15 stop:878 length:864 start_codon:yes stop_codon:yes gene_type:complete
MNNKMFKKSLCPVISIDNYSNRILSPKIFENEGTFYLYFSKSLVNKERKPNNTYVYVATSKNTEHWKINNSPIISTSPDYATHRVMSFDVVKAEKNFIGFFEGRNQNSISIFMAVSKNLTNWSVITNPILFDKHNKFSFRTPFCLKKLNHYYLYYTRSNAKKSEILLNIYSDSKFKKLLKTQIVLKQSNIDEEYMIYAPNIIKISGKYHMFYSGWSSDPVKGKIFHAVSSDGIIFEKSVGSVLEPDQIHDKKHCSEPSAIIINNKINIYYEACDNNGNWQIMLAREI